MKYVVTSVWKHPDTIDWQEMRRTMSGAKDIPHIAEIHWYAVDDPCGAADQIARAGPVAGGARGQNEA